MNVTPRRHTAFPVKVAKNTCFMLTLTRHEIHHAHTNPNTNNYLYSHTSCMTTQTQSPETNPLIFKANMVCMRSETKVRMKKKNKKILVQT